MLIIDPKKLKHEMDKIIETDDGPRVNCTTKQLAHALGTSPSYIYQLRGGGKSDGSGKDDNGLSLLGKLMIELGCKQFEQLLSWTHVDTIIEAPRIARGEFPGDKDAPKKKIKKVAQASQP